MVTLAEARRKNAADIKRLDALPTDLAKALTRSMKTFAATQVVDMKRRFAGRPGLIARTGVLQRSFFSHVENENKTVGLRALAYTRGVGTRQLSQTRTGASYAALQEFGGTIRPVRRRVLTVPTRENLGDSGPPKYDSAEALRAAGRTFLLKTQGGQYLVMVKSGSGASGYKGSGYEAMFMLRRQVKVPPRLRFFDSFKSRDSGRKAQVTREVRSAIQAN